jgi:UDPglucose 6-dehydrogenase
MRDSPSIDIIAGLQKYGGFIQAYDPEGMEEANQMMVDVNWCDSAYEAIEGADALVIITEWNEFRGLDMKRVKSLMNTPILVDLRNIYNPVDMAETGIAYSCIGRSL